MKPIKKHVNTTPLPWRVRNLIESGLLDEAAIIVAVARLYPFMNNRDLLLWARTNHGLKYSFTQGMDFPKRHLDVVGTLLKLAGFEKRSARNAIHLALGMNTKDMRPGAGWRLPAKLKDRSTQDLAELARSKALALYNIKSTPLKDFV